MSSPVPWVTSATHAKSRQQHGELCSVRSEQSGAAEPKNTKAASNSHKGMHAYEAKSRRTCAGSKKPLQVTTWKRERLSVRSRLGKVSVSQKDLDRLQDSKTAVGRAVQELSPANIRSCGAKTTLPKIRHGTWKSSAPGDGVDC